MKYQIDQLTSLRGIAAWWVVVYHFELYLVNYLPDFAHTIVTKGYLAVDFFFILSGFVIYITYGNKLQSFEKNYFINYILRRLSRIYPLHLFTLLIYISIPVSLLLFSQQGILTGKFDLLSFLFNMLLIDAWGIESELTWNIPSWSISAEWLAYLCFPFLAYVISKYLQSLIYKIIAFLILWVLFVSSFYFLGYSSVGNNVAGMAVIRCVFQFSLGCILGSIYLMDLKILLSALMRRILLSIGLVCFSLMFLSGVLDFVIIGLSFGAIILSVSLSEGMVNKILLNPFFTLLGKISYSTYMIHYFVKDWFKLLFVEEIGVATLTELISCFILIFVLSVISFKFIEMPSQRYFNEKINVRFNTQR
jgi:peptidoglycan/LPS O-acetylase OafA/YrhL